ncbi:hypothetical protein FNB79_09060 [Formosa sediminum]|uniref:Uncharacterized protein n=1 Tax=Formosa sediminum TaxID=2594004 RepID=A0A516GRH6_9FLAO|nr:hypothetical protein [Formosa sediminum]QDO94122.1 hypothetical protein FNB79_09060 [Formosa sediminum]
MKLKDLHNDNTGGFKIPKDYFNTLEDSILSQAKLQDKVSNPGFKAPDDYFETLEARILTKLDAKPKVRTLNIKPWAYAASIAACLVLMFTLTFSNNQTHSISSINNDSLESFILNEEFNTSEMATLITDTDVFENDILNSTLSDASIDYYIESVVDLEDLLDN